MATKRKKMTNAQKRFNAQVKKDMQDKGILPPDKPKLNRKKFIEEAIQEWDARDTSCYIWDMYLIKAISFMLCHTERGKASRASLEAVGVAKLLKIAIRLKEFEQMVRDRGKTEYRYPEQYEYIKDILDA